MGATLKKQPMALGELHLDLKFDQELLDDCDPNPGRLVLIYEGEKLMHAAVLLHRVPSRESPSITARELDWLLGDPKAGPLVERREYLAGNDRLFDPTFVDQDLHWKVADTSKWVLDGTRAAVIGDNEGDDALEANQTINVDPTRGERYLVTLVGHVDGSPVGRLRVRLLCAGRFQPADLAAQIGGDFEDGGAHWVNTSEFPSDVAIVNDPANALTGNWVARFGPNFKKQIIPNPSFELSGFSYWTVIDGSSLTADGWEISTDRALSGSHCLKLTPHDPGGGAFDQRVIVTTASSSGATDGDGPFEGVPIVSGEKWRCSAWFRSQEGDSSSGQMPVALKIQVRSFPTSFFDTFSQEGTLSPSILSSSDLVNNRWELITSEIDIPEPQAGDDHVDAACWLTVLRNHTEPLYVDDFKLERTGGNSGSMRSDVITGLIPMRTYRLIAMVRSGPNAVGDGGVTIAARMISPGRPDIVLESAVQQATGNQWQQLLLEVTTPSGYDSIDLTLKGADIVGDSFYVDRITIIDTDTGTALFDSVWTPSAGDTTFTHHFAVPAGAESLRLQVVAESDASGMVLHEAHLARDVAIERESSPGAGDGQPDLVADVIRDCLRSVDGSHYLIQPGTLPSGAIVHDYLAENQFHRDILRQLVQNGLTDPPLEYRARPDLTMDVGLAEDLYTEHRDLIFRDKDLKTLKLPDTENNLEGYVSEVKVIGADRKTARGDTQKVTATAAVPNATAMLDPWGYPVKRTKLVQDGTVDHPDFADLFVANAAADEARVDHSTSISASDLKAWAKVTVGDWVFVHKPSAGLEDLTNEMVDQDGETVFPVRLRLVDGILKMGTGYRAVLRRPDGSERDITDDVVWEAATTFDFSLGSLLPSFTSDPLGGSVFTQFRAFVRHRASAR